MSVVNQRENVTCEGVLFTSFSQQPRAAKRAVSKTSVFSNIGVSLNRVRSKARTEPLGIEKAAA